MLDELLQLRLDITTSKDFCGLVNKLPRRKASWRKLGFAGQSGFLNSRLLGHFFILLLRLLYPPPRKGRASPLAHLCPHGTNYCGSPNTRHGSGLVTNLLQLLLLVVSSVSMIFLLKLWLIYGIFAVDCAYRCEGPHQQTRTVATITAGN